MKLLLAALIAFTLSNDAGTSSPEVDSALSESARAEFRRHLDSLTTPALEARKAARREVQRRGYANVLADVLSDDGVGSVLSLSRMNAELEYTISHHPLSIYVPIVPSESSRALPPWFFTYKSGPLNIKLHDDWSMPENPWKH